VQTWFIFVLYTLYTPSQRIMLCTSFGKFVHVIKFHGMEFSTCDVMSWLKKCCVLEHLGFHFCIREKGFPAEIMLVCLSLKEVI
jgi:hypothetical protein